MELEISRKLNGAHVLSGHSNEETYDNIIIANGEVEGDYFFEVISISYNNQNLLKTNADSSIFYSKTKGEMERDVLQQNIKNTYILQPSIIGGNRKETRIGEKIGLVIFKLFQPFFIGKLKKYSLTEAEDIAQAMINLANSTSIKTKITLLSYKTKVSAINNNKVGL